MIFIQRDTMTAGLGMHVTICLVHRLSQDAPSPSERDTILHGGRRFFLLFFFTTHRCCIQCSVISAVLRARYFRRLMSAAQTVVHIWASGHAALLLPTALTAQQKKKAYSSKKKKKKGTSCWRWPLATGRQRRGPRTGATPSTSILDPGEQAPAILTFWEGEGKQQMWCGDWDMKERQRIFNSIIKDIQKEDSLPL